METKPSEKPKANDKATIQDLGDEVLLYDAEKEHVHILNHTAHDIWNLCDGTNTLVDIKRKLMETYSDIPEDELFTDIQETVTELRKKHLLI